MLNVPKNSTVSIYNSGCCGMAGSFGYEKNIMISMQMGRILYFQKNKYCSNNHYCSSRYQLPSSNFDGTNRNAEHPVTILKNLLK
jgi:Fe-S oxidoreductase